MRQDTSLSRMIARIDKRIADIEARRARIEQKSAKVDAWLNLYEVSPRLAMRNPHLGIVKHQEQ